MFSLLNSISFWIFQTWFMYHVIVIEYNGQILYCSSVWNMKSEKNEPEIEELTQNRMRARRLFFFLAPSFFLERFLQMRLDIPDFATEYIDISMMGTF